MKNKKIRVDNLPCQDGNGEASLHLQLQERISWRTCWPPFWVPCLR